MAVKTNSAIAIIIKYKPVCFCCIFLILLHQFSISKFYCLLSVDIYFKQWK
jgi:hypothetical protein